MTEQYIMLIWGTGLTAVTALLGFLVVRPLQQIDKNQAHMFDRILDLEKAFYHLRGEWDAHRNQHLDL